MQSLPKNSLRELPDDNRDFALGAVFPQIKIEEVPDTDFIIAEPLVKNQGDSDLCSAYAVTSVSEDQEIEELLPEYQFLKTKQITGDQLEWGAGLRSACKSAVDFGSLPVNGFENKRAISRLEIFRKGTWPDHADRIAQFHKKETFWKVVGRYDVFDNIRTALWQHRNSKSSIVTGALWRNEWLDAPGGVIPKEYGDEGFGHAFKIYGQKFINGELYLVAQLSQGNKVGDKGIFYFSREVTNREIGKYGVFMFKDISKKDAEYYLQHGFTVKTSFIKQFILLVVNFFK